MKTLATRLQGTTGLQGATYVRMAKRLQVVAVLGAICMGGTAQAAQGDAPEAAGADLKYFSGSWLCTAKFTGSDAAGGKAADANKTAVVGTMHFAPWDAWIVGSFTPQDANGSGLFPDGPPESWPPHAGHGPAVIPPRTGAIGNNLTFITYDTVARAYVLFKLVGAGVYSMASSLGPDANGTWSWDGALSDDGKGNGALVKVTMSTSDPNAFNAVGTQSTDVGDTWTETSQVRCAKQPDLPTPPLN